MFNKSSRSRSLSFDSHRRQGSFLGKASKFLFVVFSLMVATALTLFGVSSCQEKPRLSRYCRTHRKTIANSGLRALAIP